MFSYVDVSIYICLSWLQCMQLSTSVYQRKNKKCEYLKIMTSCFAHSEIRGAENFAKIFNPHLKKWE